MDAANIINIVCCPSCRRTLEGTNELVCCSCGQVYPTYDGILDMLTDDLLTRYADRIQEWRHKLALYERWWREDRNNPLKTNGMSKPWQPSPILIDNYLRLCKVNAGKERLLDVGCGEGHREGQFSDKTYLGVDPLVLKQSYSFPFFRGLAEFLPFVDESFDIVLSIEVFDHLLDPERALVEAVRVLAHGGALFIFVGSKDSRKKSPTTSACQGLYATGEDDVHLHHFSEHFFQNALAGQFKRVEVIHAGGYLAVWGWERDYGGGFAAPLRKKEVGAEVLRMP